MLIVWLVGVLFVGAQETKIDPKVSQAIRGGRSSGVILLGKRQLLEGPKGFPDFCKQNKAAKRTQLRPKIIAQLKAIAKADPGNDLHVGAPIPGIITEVAVGVGAKVAKGDKLLTMEAMKMQTTVYASADGVVDKINVGVGESVESKDLIMELREA